MCPTLDRQNLEDEFNMVDEIIEPEVVEEEPDPFEMEWEHDTSDIETVRKNVERANEILDQVQEELTNGNFTARLVEVAGNIINSITTASKVLIDDTNYNKYLDIRKSLVLLKKREVDIKSLTSRRPAGNNNLIVASREDVLQLINDKPEPEENSNQN
jgi:hypothetical protein